MQPGDVAHTGSIAANRIPPTRSRQALTETDKNRVVLGVRHELKDPAARVQDLVAGKMPNGTLIVCGWVTSSALTGKRRFAGELVTTSSEYRLYNVADDAARDKAVAGTCGDLPLAA